MRLEAQKKLGYYKTPMSVVNKVNTWLSVRDYWGNISILDPCAGEGEAVLTIADHLRNPTVYAIELDRNRFEKVERKSKYKKYKVEAIHSPYERIKFTSEFNLIWLNPPYDDHGGGESGTRRKEMIFLEDMTPLLRTSMSGILIFIIPHKYISDHMARFLANNYKNIRIFSFADDDGYDHFKQCVIIAEKGQSQYKVREDVIKRLTYARENRPPELIERPPDEASYNIWTTQSLPEYSILEYDAEEIFEISRKSKSWDRAFEDVFKAERSAADSRPPVPLHSGHIGLLLASGEMNGAFGKGPLDISDCLTDAATKNNAIKQLGVETEEEAWSLIGDKAIEQRQTQEEFEKLNDSLVNGDRAGDKHSHSLYKWRLNHEINRAKWKLEEINNFLTYDTRHIIKGTALKKVRRLTDTDENGNTTEREIEQQQIVIRAINSKGELIELV